MEIKSVSSSGQLCKGDLKRIAFNFLIYNVPVFFLSLLVGVSNGQTIKQSALPASITFLTALMDVIRKLVADNTGETNNTNGGAG